MLGIATQSDLNENKRAVCKTNRMLNLILKQEPTIAGDSTALMSSEELLANKTSEIFEEMTWHIVELTLVELMSTADWFLAEVRLLMDVQKLTPAQSTGCSTGTRSLSLRQGQWNLTLANTLRTTPSSPICNV